MLCLYLSLGFDWIKKGIGIIHEYIQKLILGSPMIDRNTLNKPRLHMIGAIMKFFEV